MKRRGVILLASVVLVPLAVLAGVVVFRIPIATAVINAELAAFDVPDPTFEVTALDLDRAQITAISLGADKELQLRSLDISYDLNKIFDGPPLGAIKDVTLDGLILKLDLTGEGPPLGSLEPLLAQPARPERKLGPIPDITLTDERIELQTPLGPVTSKLDGKLWQTDGGAISTSGDLRLSGAPGELSGTFSATLTEQGSGDGSLILEQGQLTLPASVSATAAEISGLSGAIAFTLKAWQPTTITLDLSLEGIGVNRASFKSAHLSLDVSETVIDAEMELQSDDGLLDGSLRGIVDDYRQAPRLQLDGALSASATAAVLDLLDAPLPQSGMAQLSLQAGGKLPPFLAPEESGDGLRLTLDVNDPWAVMDWFSGGRLDAHVTADLDDVLLHDGGGVISGLIDAEVGVVDGAITLDLASDSMVEAHDLDPARLLEAGLPQELVDLIAPGVMLSVSAAEAVPTHLRLRPSAKGSSLSATTEIELDTLPGGLDTPSLTARGSLDLDLDSSHEIASFAAKDVHIRLRNLQVARSEISETVLSGAFSGTPDDFSGTADLRVEASRFVQNELSGRNLKLDLPAKVELADRVLSLTLDKRGKISIGRLSSGEVKTTAPFAVTVIRSHASLTLPGPATAGGDLTNEAEIEIGDLKLNIERGQQEPLEVDINPGRVTLTGQQKAGSAYQGRVRAKGGSVTLPELALSAKGVALTADITAGFATAKTDFTVSKLESTEANPPFAPLHLAGHIDRNRNKLSFDVAARLGEQPDATKDPLAQLSGNYDVARETGTITLKPTVIEFAPGVLQPKQLVPGLPKLGNVIGRVAAEAKAVISESGIGGTARVDLDGVSLAPKGMSIEDLALALSLDNLWPPGSPAGQRLTVNRFDAALPIENVEAAFQLLPKEQPQAWLERLEFRFADGTFQVRDTLVNPAGNLHEAKIDVTGLDFGKLLEFIGLEGLSGAGKLNGTLPVRVEGETVIIDGAKLEAESPGLLSYISDTVITKLPPDADALQLLENPTDLAIRALENFHYDELSVELSKKANGQTHLLLHLSGKNPDLLDGYPFNFNINLNGNMEPILTAIRRGLTLSDEVLKRTWRLTP